MTRSACRSTSSSPSRSKACKRSRRRSTCRRQAYHRDVSDQYRTIIEPFRIHAVEPLRFLSDEERRTRIRDAGYNLFNLHADDVLIDFLTDSGTGAMSRDQWAAIQHGDESYAGSPSWHRFADAVRELFPFRRAIPNNTHFDTTRANVEFTGAEAVDLVIEEGRRPQLEHPFKGNMDLDALDRYLGDRPGSVPLVMVTITNNSGGGQPVSLENLHDVRAVCDRHS